MPFAEIVESLVVVSSSRKEIRQERAMMLRVSYEMGGSATACLNRDIDDAEDIVCDMLSYEQPAYLPCPTAQVTFQAFDYL